MAVNNNRLQLPDTVALENPYFSERYRKLYEKSIHNPEEFWGEIGNCIEWTKPWEKVLDDRCQPFTKW